MKKALLIFSIFIYFLIIYFLESNFFTWFNINGIKPNLFIILMVVIGAFINKYYGFGIGVFLGLLLDLFIGKSIGINGIVLGIAGLLGGVFTKTFSKDNKMTLIVLVSVTTLICEIISYIYQIILFGLPIEILNFVKIILIEILYNSILLIVLYPLLKKLGNSLEKAFTKDNILTRYY